MRAGGWSRRIAFPSPPGRGRTWCLPAKRSFSPRHAMRTILTVSLRRVSGARYGTPCNPSTTCGPLAPSPSTKRPPDSACSDNAVIAVIDGTRALICMMPEPRTMRFVCAARKASDVAASCAHASADQAYAAPMFSAATMYRAVAAMSRRS